MGKEDISETQVDDGFVEQPRAGIWEAKHIGDTIEGVVTSITEGKFGPVYMVHVPGEETDIALPSHQALISRMTKAKPGMTVRVVYEGEELPKVKGQNPTKLYKVFLKE